MKSYVKAWLTLCVLLLLLSPFQAVNAANDIKSQKKVSPGVIWENILRTTDNGPLVINVLRVDLTNPYISVATMNDNDNLQSRHNIKYYAETYGAVAAINGTFQDSNAVGGIASRGPLIESGCIITTTNNEPNVISVNNQNTVRLDDWTAEITLIAVNGKTSSVKQYNKFSVEYKQLGLLDRRFGAKSIGALPEFPNMVEMVVADGYVTEIRESMPAVDIPENGFIIYVNKEANKYNFISSNFKIGDRISVTIESNPDWRTMQMAIRGDCTLISNGAVTPKSEFDVSKYPSAPYKAPRTAIGASQDGKEFILVTVDGRQPELSIGLTYEDTGHLMKELGAYNAINLDGGGSSTMVIKDLESSEYEVVNDPSDGRLRSVINGIGIFSTAPSEGKTVTSIEVTGEDVIQISDKDTTVTYTAVVKDQLEAPMQSEGVSWSVEPQTDGVSISSSGILSIKNTAKPGSVTVVATSITKDTVKGSKVVYLEDLGMPYWPQDSKLTASNITHTGATLSWTAAQDDQAIVDYAVYRVDDSILTVVTDDYTCSDAVYSADIAGLSSGTAYKFTVLAVDNDGKQTITGPVAEFRTLADASISPVTYTYNKAAGRQEDIVITMTLDGNTLQIIKNGSGTMTDGTDYNVANNVVTIKKEYFATFEAGNTVTLTFKFTAGADATLQVSIVDIPSSSSGSSGKSGSRERESEIKPVKNEDGTVTINAPVVSDTKTKTSTVVLDATTLQKAFELAGTEKGDVKTIITEIPKAEGITSYVQELPKEAIASTGNQQIQIQTEFGSLLVPGNMFNAADVKGATNVSVSIGMADITKLSKEARELIGSRPVIELNACVDGEKIAWNNQDAPVTISIPYQPTAEERKNSEHIIVQYIDGQGNLIAVPSGRYNSKTGMVTFTTTHFSRYAVAYVVKTFDDVQDYAWTKKEIEVLASKGIIRGTSDNLYAPQANITRADFLVLLIRTLGLTAEFDTNFEDVKSSDYYYNAIGVARKLGITNGIGKNLYDPMSPISRQDMLTLSAKALSITNKLKAKGNSADLAGYVDFSDIAPYSVDSIASLVKVGLVKGDGIRINPLSNATRAEIAVLMYRIYNQ